MDREKPREAFSRGSALHMAAEEGRDGLGQLVFRVAGGCRGDGADKKHQSQQITLRQNGSRHGSRQLIRAVGDRKGLSLSGKLIDSAAVSYTHLYRVPALA